MDGAMPNLFCPDSYFPVFSWPLKFGASFHVLVGYIFGETAIQIWPIFKLSHVTYDW